MSKIFKYHFLFFFASVLLCSCGKEDDGGGNAGQLQLNSALGGTVSLLGTEVKIPADSDINLLFSAAVNAASVSEISLTNDAGQPSSLTFDLRDNDKIVNIVPSPPMSEGEVYNLVITDQFRGSLGENFPGLTLNFTIEKIPLTVVSLKSGAQTLATNTLNTDIPLQPTFQITLSHDIPLSVLQNRLVLVGDKNYALNITQTAPAEYELTTTEPLRYLTKCNLLFPPNIGDDVGRPFATVSYPFYSELDETPKFPLISDDELLTQVQAQTFKYFWDFGHPTSGLSRERNTSGNTVTTGGSGFGLMAIVVGMERGFVTRAEGVERLEKIITFLKDKADRFNGIWSHWLHGETGKVIPFSNDDDGADLVETSFLVMGMLTVRQYLDPNDPQEQNLINDINQLWQEVQWDWHTKGGQNVLYWHWSPNFAWQKNHQIGGWNEALITYVLAAASPTHPISKEVYDQGWARNGAMVNGNNYFGIQLPLGPGFGGPLFFEQYSFLGINPTNLTDAYANYWQQGVNHTLINRQHCIQNPSNYVAYSERCWGLTASDGNNGYSAHSPTNDRGVITPTAALSSFPFTPDESMDALHFFYYTMGDRLWGEHGFYDAFNPTAGWTANSFLAIDQGPIIGMIENYRTGLLWDLFMSAPEVQDGLTKLGFNF
ncbi:MAG: glucoamylase family protein [Saprospiraceae bacterium]